jgi:hypothetical protein
VQRGGCNPWRVSSIGDSGPRALLVLAILLGTGCGGGHQAARFTARVDNPWFPLRPGTTYVYRGIKDGKPARDVVTVTHRTHVVRGARCVVVSDRLYLSGRLRERTADWYTQDRRGNVWYFGEKTAELRPDGTVETTEGSWQAGVDGAKPGIFMPARAEVGKSFRQEYYKGHAEDHFQVLDLAAGVTVPFVRTSKALLTKEWTPLEPDVVDHKYYVRGVGTVLERTAKGSKETLRLVRMTR